MESSRLDYAVNKSNKEFEIGFILYIKSMLIRIVWWIATTTKLSDKLGGRCSPHPYFTIYYLVRNKRTPLNKGTPRPF